MEVAQLILGYLRVLAWPTAVLGALFLYRRPIWSLIDRIREVRVAGISVEHHSERRGVLMPAMPAIEPLPIGDSEPTLNTLSDEFDALLARTQTPEARAAMKSAFDAPPEKLGEAARDAAKKRA